MACPPLSLVSLDTALVGRRILFYQETQSTNTAALAAPRDGMVYVAERQHAGRGRHGRRWHSAPGLGLWFSVALKGPAQGLDFAGALAVRRAVRARVELAVKWPNDLECGGKKVCGVLVERRGAWNALGIGVNVHHAPGDFPPEIRSVAGSLESQTGQAWDRAQLLGDILKGLDEYVGVLRRGGFDTVLAEWRAACDLTGKVISRNGHTGRVLALDEQGALLIETADGLWRATPGAMTKV